MRANLVKVYTGLALLTLVTLVTTFASGITINSDDHTEFGQGLYSIVVCDKTIGFSISSKMDTQTSEYYVDSLTLKDLSVQLHDRTLKVNIYDSDDRVLNNPISFSVGEDGLTYTSTRSHTDILDGTTTGQGSLAEKGSSSITFNSLLTEEPSRILASKVFRFATESSGYGNCSIPPSGVFTSGYSEVGTAMGNWYGTCIVANSSKFYALDYTNGLYASSTIPAFPGSVASVTTSRVTSSNIPTSGVNWYSLGCSASGQYIAIGGTSNQISYSGDYGATWESRTVSTFNPGSGSTAGNNVGVSISADGKVVALATAGSTTGFFNFWVNGNFWNSPNTAADGTYSVSGGAASIKVSSDGSTIYGGAQTQGLYRWNSSGITSGGNKASINPAYSSSAFGNYIRSIGCSSDGKSAIIASPSNYQVYITRDKFVTSYTPTGLATSNQGNNQKPYAVSMSSSGRYVAVATGSYLTSNTGTTQYSTNFGENLTNTSFINRYMQTIAIADNGSRIVTGGGGYAPSTKIVILGSG